ncbi:response regulator transcription factor [Euzebya pacifica]|jgi:two-component system OmpR family response regulator|uniref:response regulator transcription factor n=1 Tax=Euzebya pacifica TaxID=1608957 RepID=UPI0030F525A5
MSDQHPASGHILVVEDEPAISDIVSTALRYQGHTVTAADTGTVALDLAMTIDFDMIVLDIMLPGLDGLEVCRRLRDSGRFAPVLFLTARDEQDDRIKGFVVGGDDYLTKPFSVDELVLRVAAILRRAPDGQPTEALVVDDLVLDPAGMEVRRGGTAIELSRTEFRLLHYLMTNAGIVVSKTQILLNVWEYDYAGGANVVELYIGYLRRKVDDGREPLIHTKRGAGYVLRRPQA